MNMAPWLYKLFNSKIRTYSVNQPVNQSPEQPSEKQWTPQIKIKGLVQRTIVQCLWSLSGSLVWRGKSPKLRSMPGDRYMCLSGFGPWYALGYGVGILVSTLKSMVRVVLSAASLADNSE